MNLMYRLLMGVSQMMEMHSCTVPLQFIAILLRTIRCVIYYNSQKLGLIKIISFHFLFNWPFPNNYCKAGCVPKGFQRTTFGIVEALCYTGWW